MRIPSLEGVRYFTLTSAVSLPLGLFSLADRLRAGTEVPGFIDTVVDDLPYLTVFAVEEPENHLSPHYLGKVVTILKQTAVGDNAQVLLSSHSPSIMARIDPENVRYFLGGESRVNTVVKRISLPQSTDEAYKYVREAVRGFPELYFARLVVLGEGPSEEIVLRRAFEASGEPLDELFVSVVPLGGRHVHHFWRLLQDLNIPHLTLLDLDLGRKTGGMERVANIIRQLVDYHGEDVNVEFGRLRTENPDSGFEAVLTRLREKYDVYFVEPLDLDYAMLKAYPDVYKRPRPGGRGPDIPHDAAERTVYYENRARQILGLQDGEPIASEYPEAEHNLFAWYSYLFLNHSKPVTHMHALVQLASEPGWIDRLPEALSKLVARAGEIVSKDGGDS